jgi:hypothetical protein
MMRDPRFENNIFVRGAPFVRFYAGAQLKVSGVAVGSLCAIDTRPRDDFDAEATSMLVDLAAIKAGKISFNAGHSIVDCTVRGLSRETATIEVNTTAGIPEQFKLAIAVDALSRACRITAKHDNRIEVAFT